MKKNSPFNTSHLSLLGLLAKIKCSICSYQLNLWYKEHVSFSRLTLFLCLGGCCSLLYQTPSVAPVLQYLRVPRLQPFHENFNLFCPNSLESWVFGPYPLGLRFTHSELLNLWYLLRDLARYFNKKKWGKNAPSGNRTRATSLATRYHSH